jgi:hypothetical protein
VTVLLLSMWCVLASNALGSNGSVSSEAAAQSSLPASWSRASVVIVDALWTLLGDSPRPPAFAAETMCRACRDNGFTFIRVAGTAFWPLQLERYTANRTRYLAAVDALYNHSAACGCQVLLSVFWNWFTVPDLMHEPLGAAMRNTTSATRAFMAAYFGDIVEIAAAYPAAVAGWELGNELNLIADLNLTGSDVSIAPSLGTPKFRTSADNFSTSDMIDFETWLAATMRTAASAKGLPTIISTGHAIPRRCAYHLQRSYHAPQRDWSPDTKAQFGENLRATCGCCELCSIHFYAGSGGRWGTTTPNSTEPLLVAHEAVKETGSANKTLYLGEFGEASPGVAPHDFSLDVLRTVNATGIRLATIWVWEFYQSSATEMAPYSISPSMPRDTAIIAALKSLNSAAGTCV